jgi:excisionase family DNA binding protein
MDKDEMLTPKEVAEYLKVPLGTVWRWCRAGALPALKIGKYWRVPREELNGFIKSKVNFPRRPTGAASG